MALSEGTLKSRQTCAKRSLGHWGGGAGTHQNQEIRKTVEMLSQKMPSSKSSRCYQCLA